VSSRKHPTRTERSAGGVVWCRVKLLRTRQSELVEELLPNQTVVLAILDSHGHWAFPKGRIAAGEHSEAAARREVAEETGVDALTVTTILPTSDFWFEDKWEVPGERVHKFVDYFLFELVAAQPVVTSATEHIEAFQWVTLEALSETVAYPSLAPVVAATVEHLSAIP
jgi:8-oxo-dGTP pyrophosphatase MutT (NUDIX family)